MVRSYSDLRRINGFEERYHYLSLRGSVGRETFGFDRYLNQDFYRSAEWRNLRYLVIARDNGCDLGVEGYEIHSRLYIHHMNPVSVEDLVSKSDDLLNPDYLITTTHSTHNAIHYGRASMLPKPALERKPGDTKLW